MTGLASVPFLCANLFRTYSLFNHPFIKNVTSCFILSAMYRRSATKKVWSQVLSFSLGTSLPKRALMPALMTLIRSLKTLTTPLATKRSVCYIYLLVYCNLTNWFIKVVLLVFLSVLHVVLYSTTLYVVCLCHLIFYSSYLLVFFKKCFNLFLLLVVHFYSTRLHCLFSALAFMLLKYTQHSRTHPLPFPSLLLKVCENSFFFFCWLNCDFIYLRSFFPLLPRLIELLL